MAAEDYIVSVDYIVLVDCMKVVHNNLGGALYRANFVGGNLDNGPCHYYPSVQFYFG